MGLEEYKVAQVVSRSQLKHDNLRLLPFRAHLLVSGDLSITSFASALRLLEKECCSASIPASNGHSWLT